MSKIRIELGNRNKKVIPEVDDYFTLVKKETNEFPFGSCVCIRVTSEVEDLWLDKLEKVHNIKNDGNKFVAYVVGENRLSYFNMNEEGYEYIILQPKDDIVFVRKEVDNGTSI